MVSQAKIAPELWAPLCISIFRAQSIMLHLSWLRLFDAKWKQIQMSVRLVLLKVAQSICFSKWNRCDTYSLFSSKKRSFRWRVIGHHTFENPRLWNLVKLTLFLLCCSYGSTWTKSLCLFSSCNIYPSRPRIVLMMDCLFWDAKTYEHLLGKHASIPIKNLKTIFFFFFLQKSDQSVWIWSKIQLSLHKFGRPIFCYASDIKTRPKSNLLVDI